MNSTAEKNEYKSGYKKTELGWIPKGWNIAKLENLGSFSKGKGIRKDEVMLNGYPCIRYGEIYKDFNFIVKKTHSFINCESAKNSEKIKRNDILFTGSGEKREEIGKAVAYMNDQEAYAGGDIIIFTPEQNAIGSYFLSYYLNTEGRKYLNKLGQGDSIVHIYQSQIGLINVILPPIQEQEKIVQILTTWDCAIDKTEKLLKTKQIQKKTIMQILLTEKKRFIQFAEQKWRKLTIGDIFAERKETSKDIEKFSLFSLTIAKGLTEKTERYERSFLLKNKEENQYRLVYPNDILYNPMNIRFGAIARSKIDAVVCVSAYYSVMQLTKNDFNIIFFEYLFKSQKLFNLYESVATGSLLEKKRVHLSEFLKLNINCPPPEEQQKIAAVLDGCDKEIELLNKQLEALKEQKKGLMQKLLTGQIRVKQ